MSTNDITGARLVSRVNDKNYEDGYDRIFRKKVEDCCINYEPGTQTEDCDCSGFCTVNHNKKDVIDA